jgi:hypothetical protein
LTTGGDEKNKWIDFIIYSGTEKEFYFEKIQETIIGFLVSLNDKVANQSSLVKIQESEDYMNLSWNGLNVKALKKPYSEKVSLVLK